MFKKFKPFAGSKVFEFKDPDTGRQFKGSNVPDLLKQVRGYREQNRFEEIEYLPEVIENYLCSLPVNAGACQQLKTFKRGVIATMRGGIGVLKNLAYKSFATQEVADARSEVCAKCPKNAFPDRDKFIKWSDDIAEMSVGNRRSKNHDLLGICDVCSCPMRAKVFIKGTIALTQEQLDEMKTLGCWQPEFSKVVKA